MLKTYIAENGADFFGAVCTISVWAVSSNLRKELGGEVLGLFVYLFWETRASRLYFVVVLSAIGGVVYRTSAA